MILTKAGESAEEEGEKRAARPPEDGTADARRMAFPMV